MDVRMRARVFHAEGPRTIHFTLRVPEHALDDFIPDISPEELEMLMNATLQSDEVQHSTPLTSLEVLNAYAEKQRFNRSLHCPGKDETGQCSICLDVFTARTRRYVRKLPCGHVFCSGCIEKWITKQSATCPTCREPLEQ